jgi:tetratricopeptide (TPR) repeat protein
MNRNQRRANARQGRRSAHPAVAGMLALGFGHHQAGKLAEAERCYRQVLAIQPNHPDALQLLGAVAYQLGHYDVAAESIRCAIKQDPTNPAWFSNLGLALEGQGKFEEALLSHNSALKLKPDNAEVLNNRGNALRALGRTDEALASYDAALVFDPNYVQALNNRGAILHSRNRYDEALISYDRALALKPDYPDAFNNRGNSLRELGRFDEALACYDMAVALKPRFFIAFNSRGMVLRDMNRFDDAIASYEMALALNPSFVEVHNNRGVALAEVGRSDEALLSYARALSLSPNFVATLNNRGNLLQELGRADEALADYDKALAIDPNYVDAINGRGSALQKLKRVEEAENVLRHAILLNPHHAEAYCNLGTVLVDLGRLPEAEAVIRQAVELKPGHAEACFNLGTVLFKLGRPDEAEQATRRALALKPDLAGAHHNLGVALMERGRLTEAREAAEKAVALAPLEPSHFRQLGELRTYVAGDPYLRALEALSKQEPLLDTGRRIDLHFALAKAHADMGQRDDEFRRLLAGNKLKRSCVDYDEAEVLGKLDRAQRVFTPAFIRTAQGHGQLSSKPIFIIGMPRSGTTLVEQILASHPQVFGAGELKLFEQALADVHATMQDAPGYPEIAPCMAGEHFRELGGRYLAEIQQLAPAASHITDKMPANFVFAGLIHLALPNAVMIHIVRDPRDTCISCFSKLFTEGNFQTYDLAELGRYYRHYQALMAHWRRVLPAGRILDLNYEDVVADTEAAARCILAHCDLPWDPNCLDFHRTERVVRTSSSAQVRKPIYASSIGRWRAFQPFLEPLLSELAPLR